MTRGRGMAARLERALIASAGHAGCDVSITQHDTVAWASATFEGFRHEITLSVRPQQHVGPWLDSLADAEFTLRGYIVADLEVVDVTEVPAGAIARIAVLTLVD